MGSTMTKSKIFEKHHGQNYAIYWHENDTEVLTVILKSYLYVLTNDLIYIIVSHCKDEEISAFLSDRNLKCSWLKWDLGWKDIDDKECNIISRVLKRNNILTRLDLEGNDIGHEGATAIATSLGGNRITKKVLFFWL